MCFEEGDDGFSFELRNNCVARIKNNEAINFFDVHHFQKDVELEFLVATVNACFKGDGWFYVPDAYIACAFFAGDIT